MASTTIKTYSKYVVDRRQLILDYSCWLEETEKLTDFQVTITPYFADTPLVVSGTFPDAEQKKLAMMVSGGKANTNYVISMVVRTDLNQVKRDDIGMRVTL